MTEDRDDVRRLRAKPRLKAFQPTEMRRADGVVAKVHLLDLSGTGALVHAAEPPATGETVHLFLNGAFRAGDVAWSEERRFGLHFRVPMTDAQVAELLAAREAMLKEADRRLDLPARWGIGAAG